MKSDIQLSIVTPTYNRASALGVLYDSLCKQTNKDFQWLIIDDGSTDQTEELVKIFQKEEHIRIDYYYKSNGGKHTALNYSHQHIRGRYVVIVDSDDFLVPTAVESILKCWKKYENVDAIAGITLQKGGIRTKKALDTSIKGEFISDFVSETNKGMSGDHCETVRTEVFNSFSFPEYSGERFIPEAAMWYLATKDHKVVYSDKIIYMCEYLEGGLTKSGRKLHLKNPRGCMWHASVFLNKDFKFSIRFKKAMLVVCYGRVAGMDIRQILNNLKEYRLIVLVAYIPGCLIKRYWER